MKLNPNLYAKPEWTEPNGMLLTGLSLEDLFAKIAAYRKAHGLEPGDPRAEFTERFCQANPGHCIGAPKPVAKREAPRVALNTRILNWVERVVALASKTGYVEAPEAKRRAEICAACPRQKEWESKCAGCAQSVRSIRRGLIGRLAAKITGSGQLQGCDTLGEDTQISIWLNREPVNDSGLPDKCWRRKPKA